MTATNTNQASEPWIITRSRQLFDRAERELDHDYRHMAMALAIRCARLEAAKEGSHSDESGERNH